MRREKGHPVIRMRRALSALIPVGCLPLPRVAGTCLDPAPYLNHLRAYYAA